VGSNSRSFDDVVKSKRGSSSGSTEAILEEEGSNNDAVSFEENKSSMNVALRTRAERLNIRVKRRDHGIMIKE
jgi:hypothetical protein